jgi:hypothetical protein
MAIKQTQLPPALPGVAVLQRWLDDHELSQHAFAIENRIDNAQLSKLMRGMLERVSVELASKIEAGTNGEVPMRLWVPRAPAKVLR